MIKEGLIILSYDIWFYITQYVLHWPAVYSMHIPSTLSEMFDGRHLRTIRQILGACVPLLFWSYSLKEFVVPLVFIGVRGLARYDGRPLWLRGKHDELQNKYNSCNLGEYCTAMCQS
jgi:hypothetical protein